MRETFQDDIEQLKGNMAQVLNYYIQQALFSRQLVEWLVGNVLLAFNHCFFKLFLVAAVVHCFQEINADIIKIAVMAIFFILRKYHIALQACFRIVAYFYLTVK